MRVLKFRFYDFKVKNQMIYQNPIEAKDVIFNQWENTPKCSPLMQYTGLKDSKGVEIYEGDIIKNHNGRILKITFDVGSYFAEGYTKLGNEMCVPVNSCNESSEVIGNIYENPELLEEQS